MEKKALYIILQEAFCFFLVIFFLTKKGSTHMKIIYCLQVVIKNKQHKHGNINKQKEKKIINLCIQ